jgi:hypothetical protein
VGPALVACLHANVTDDRINPNFSTPGKERWRVGAVVPLQPTDDSPFLGNLKTAAPQLAAEVGSLPGGLVDAHIRYQPAWR